MEEKQQQEGICKHDGKKKAVKHQPRVLSQSPVSTQISDTVLDIVWGGYK